LTKSHERLIQRFPEDQQNLIRTHALELKQIVTPQGFMSDKTLTDHLRALKQFIIEYLDSNIENISIELIKKFLYKSSGSYNYKTTLKRFCACIGREDLVQEILTLHKPKMVQQYVQPGQEKKWILNEDKWLEVMKHPETKKYRSRRFFIFMSLHFATRPNELLNLDIKQDLFLDAEKPFFKIQPHPESRYHPKTINGIRTLYIFPQHMSYFRSYLKWRLSLNIKHNFLFVNTRFNPVSSTKEVDKWVSKITVQTEDYGKIFTRQLTCKVFRYTGLWFYYKKTKNLYAVSKFAGHANINQTIAYMNLTQAQKDDEIYFMMQQALT